MNQKTGSKIHLFERLWNNKKLSFNERFGLLIRQQSILQQIGRNQPENQNIFIIRKRSFTDFFTAILHRLGLVSKTGIFPDLVNQQPTKKEEIGIFNFHPDQLGTQQGGKDIILLNFPMKQSYSYVPIQTDSLNQIRRKRNI